LEFRLTRCIAHSVWMCCSSLSRIPLLSAAVLVTLNAPIGLAAQRDRGVSVAAIVARWTAANRVDFDAAQTYNYSERIRDDDGTKTYAVTMLSGTPYKRLVQVDGKPLSAGDRRDEDERFAREQRDRAEESPDEHAHRVAEYRQTRTRAHRILVEMPRAFDYALRSTRRVHSRTVYVLAASPRRGYDPPSVEAQVLTGMRGEFWIDTATFQLLRGWARVLRPVSIEGFLATVQPGTEFVVEQQPVGGGVWLPTHLSIRSRSSIIFLFHHHTSEDRTYFNYRKASAS
jgi:hypothetical protein